ncbi:hypothetical protein [Vibrio nomapromontoriensis]|uniref:hypothetical protein n=1 Tax=Vibrio nomapromontoriensis TaxID=2910246 RepID=UPI003D0CD022
MSKYIRIRGFSKIFWYCWVLFLVGVPVLSEAEHLTADLGPIPAGKVVEVQFPVTFKYCWYFTTDDNLGTADFRTPPNDPSRVIPKRIEYSLHGGGASEHNYGGDFVYAKTILNNFPDNTEVTKIIENVGNENVDPNNPPKVTLSKTDAWAGNMTWDAANQYYHVPFDGRGIEWWFSTQTKGWNSFHSYQGPQGITSPGCGYRNGQGALYTEYVITEWLVDTRGLEPGMAGMTEPLTETLSFRSPNYSGVTIDVNFTAIDETNYNPNCSLSFPGTASNTIQFGDVTAGKTRIRNMQVELTCSHATTAVLKFTAGQDIVPSDPTKLQPLPGTYLSLFDDEGRKVPLDGSEIYFTGLNDVRRLYYDIELDASQATDGGSFNIPITVTIEANYRQDFSDGNL